MPREVGQWTLEKLRILRQYLPVYLQATTRAVERNYIDAFAGPGTNQLKGSKEIVDGSPRIALSSKSANGTTFDRYYFIAKDLATVAELKTSIADLPVARRAEVVPGDVNFKLPEVMQKISRRSPTFVFLDTEGIDPKWETIEKIAPWQVELLINFPLGMSINRNPNSTKNNEFFGTDEWRPLWESTEPARKLLDLYKSRLKKLGFEYTTDVDPLITDKAGHKLYYLVFVSKVEPAKRIMKWVQEQPDSAGQLSFKF